MPNLFRCLCVLALLPGLEVVAQELPLPEVVEPPKIDVDEAIGTALSNNPIIRAADSDIEVAKAKLFREWGRYIPRITFQALFAVSPAPKGDALNGYLDFDEWGPVFRGELDGEVRLYAFGQLSALRDVADAGVEIKRAEREVVRSELRFLTQQAYYGWVFAEEAKRVIADGRKYLTRARERLEELEEDDSPDFDPVEKLKMRVQEATVAQQEAEVAKQLKIAQSSLKAVMARAPNDPVVPASAKLEPVEVELATLDEYVALADRHRPEVLVSRGRLARAQARVDRRFAEFFPQIGIRGFFDVAVAPHGDDQRSPFANDPYNQARGGVGLNLWWSFDIGQQLGKHQEAAADRNRAEFELEAYILQVRADVARAFFDVEQNLELIRIQKKAKKAARGWLIAKSDLYDAGFGSIDEVSAALVEYFKRRVGYLEAVYSFNLAVCRLWRVVGVDVRALGTQLEPAESGSSPKSNAE